MGQEVQKQEEKKILVASQNNSQFAPNEEVDSDFSIFETNDILPIIDISQSLHDSKIPFGPFSLNDATAIRKFLFNPSHLVSKNFIKTADLVPLSLDVPLKPVDFFLLRAVKTTTKWQFQSIALSINESESFVGYFKAAKHDRNRLYQCLYDIHGKVIAGDTVPDSARVHFEKALLKAKVEHSLFNGKEVYPKAEEGVLFSLVQNKEDELLYLFQALHGLVG
jgi:hypothetical protein